MPPKSFDLLVFLVENHGKLVSKEQILEAVWAGSFVEESNLTVCISALRRSLGEAKSDMQYIETVTKAGYRFTAPVREVEGPSSSSAEAASEAEEAPDRVESNQPPAGSPPVQVGHPGGWVRRLAWLWVVAIFALFLFAAFGYRSLRQRQQAAALVKVPRSLAILPFRNLGQDPNSDFLGFSLADAVITKLGYVSAITVRPSSAVERYRDQVIDIQKVGGDLKVDTLLTGNIVREGDNLRITPQLIDVKTSRILWDGSIDLKFDKLLTVQDKVAQHIVQGLQLNLSPSERQRLKQDAPVKPIAYEYYLRGVDLYARNDFPMAIRILEKSAELDPNYALTWAEIGRSYTAAGSFEMGGAEQYRKAEAAYAKALALEPAQIETHIYMANFFTDTGRVEQAVPLLRQALKTNQNHAELHWELGYAYRFGGMARESVAECERARQLDPVVKISTSAMNGYLYLGEYERFLKSLPDSDSTALILFYRGFGAYYENRREEASGFFNRAFALNPSMVQAQTGNALSYAMTKQPAKGAGILRAAETKIQQRGVGDPEAIYKVSEVYAVLGDKQSSLRMLGYSIEHGFFPYPYFDKDPMLDNLRAESEFVRLMQIARRRHEAFKTAFF